MRPLLLKQQQTQRPEQKPRPREKRKLGPRKKRNKGLIMRLTS